MKQSPANRIRPPPDLSASARKLFLGIVADYRVDDTAGVALCGEAARAYDRLTEARRIIARDGCTQRDRFGQEKIHAACVVERDAASHFLQALKALKLEPASNVRDDD